MLSLARSSGWESRNGLIEYIKNQQEHHRRESFIDEFRRLLRESGLEWVRAMSIRELKLCELTLCGVPSGTRSICDRNPASPCGTMPG
jgi:hypothetical protein